MPVCSPGMKRISDKRTKNQAKTDKTKHGMEKRGKDKVKSKPKSTKVKVNPEKSMVKPEAKIEETLNGPTWLRNKPVVAKVSASSSTLGISPDVAELKEMAKALLLDKKNQTQAPAPVKAVEESCVTCGGTHSYRNSPATNGNVYRDNIQEYVSQAAAANINQGNTSYRAPIANQIRPPGFPPVQQNQGNNQNRYNQNRGNNYN
ncbi:hypothetical protein Tco_0880637 [Tanacetum coccineum]